MKNKEILQKIGLNEKETEIYLCLLEFGALTISGISEKTGIHRPLIYKALPSLKEKGLVSLFPKAKQKKYVAESPEKLQILFNSFSSEFLNFIPELKSVYNSQDKKPIVKFLEGKNGIKFVFEDLIGSLKKGDVFYRYSSAKDTKKANSYLPENYRKIRDQKQLERFVITSEKTEKSKKPRLERAIKTIPKGFDLFEYDITQIIYSNKIAFLDYNTNTALIIENKAIAEFQKKLFKLLYSKL